MLRTDGPTPHHGTAAPQPPLSPALIAGPLFAPIGPDGTGRPALRLVQAGLPAAGEDESAGRVRPPRKGRMSVGGMTGGGPHRRARANRPDHEDRQR